MRAYRRAGKFSMRARLNGYFNKQHYTIPDDTMTQNDEWIEQTVQIELLTLGRRTNWQATDIRTRLTSYSTYI